MSFKIPDKPPTNNSTFEEWADFAEYQVLISNNQIRLKSLFDDEKLILDELATNGIEEDGDEIDEKEENLSSELNRRSRLLEDKYPFELNENGYILKIKPSQSQLSIIYKFLLFCTRFDMLKNKIQNKKDGTHVFEKLSSYSAQIYFGKRSKSFVFGTSISGGFNEKVKQLIKAIGEGGVPKHHEKTRPKDDSLDLVVYNDFMDKKSSKCIAFGQCKTGTSWVGDLTELDVEGFCKTWFSSPLLVNPIKVFFISQYFPIEFWNNKGFKAGIIFDRFRILECIDNDLPKELFKEIRDWTEGAETFITPNNNISLKTELRH